jgi:hypothetical protein
MAWTIHSWSPDLGTGSISSPHFGPITFDASANVDHVVDFRVGEAVVVELDGVAPDFNVRTLRPAFARQPPDTDFPAFSLVNRRFDDAFVEDYSAQTLLVWLGSCCQYCTPNPTRVRFGDVAVVKGMDVATLFSDPVFRLASRGEVVSNGLEVPDAATAFCLSSFGEAPDGPHLYIVARGVEIVPPREADVL